MPAFYTESPVKTCFLKGKHTSDLTTFKKLSNLNKSDRLANFHLFYCVKNRKWFKISFCMLFMRFLRLTFRGMVIFMDKNAKEILRCHAASKHHFDCFARYAGYMDRKNQPDPFRHYKGCESILLPLLTADPAGSIRICTKRQTIFWRESWKYGKRTFRISTLPRYEHLKKRFRTAQ